VREKGNGMKEKTPTRRFTRRDFLKFGGQGALALAAGGALGGGLSRLAGAQSQDPLGVYRSLGATDGFIKTPDGKSFYTFGFADLTNVASNKIYGLKGKARVTAPNLVAIEGQHLYVKLTNLGLVVRPDLDDSHTLHFHGFPNAISLFDGVPEQSWAVPVNRSFTYYYNLRQPGTYPYHCHFEDVEHIQMGMVGTIIVRPKQGQKYVYNDASTRFDREFVMFISELDAEVHHNLETIQEGQTDWSNYAPDYWLLNGRAYPDTIKANNATSLPYQPVSSLIKVNSGDRVLLRLNNLGYQDHSLEAPGISFRVVGEDARPLRDPAGTDLSYMTGNLLVAPGQTLEAIFTAPNRTQLTKYRLYNRYLQQTNTSSSGGMMTEIWVYPAGTLGAQTGPNR
jgi:FtsP/CotA-like multicopper oxidase with cupredoxin domain